MALQMAYTVKGFTYGEAYFRIGQVEERRFSDRIQELGNNIAKVRIDLYANAAARTEKIRANVLMPITIAVQGEDYDDYFAPLPVDDDEARLTGIYDYLKAKPSFSIFAPSGLIRSEILQPSGDTISFAEATDV